jgi:hypothetical protein
MKDHFGLSHRRLEGRDLRFNDVRFNPKRLWFCRVLAQILLDDVIVINIDESSFNFRNHRQSREW